MFGHYCLPTMQRIQNIRKCGQFLNACISNYYKSIIVSEFKYHTYRRLEHFSKRILWVQGNNLKCQNYFKTFTVNYEEESGAKAENVEDQTSEKKPAVDPSKDRTRIIPPETSIRYLKSEAYKTTYGNEPVWVKYRRNFKGQYVPRKTRKSCIRNGVITTGSPCPICRDEYLVVHYTNVDLLKQFIRPETGELYDCRITHVCQKKLFQLEIAIKKAKFYGLLTYEVPFRKYNYEEYYPQWKG